MSTESKISLTKKEKGIRLILKPFTKSPLLGGGFSTAQYSLGRINEPEMISDSAAFKCL